MKRIIQLPPIENLFLFLTFFVPFLHIILFLFSIKFSIRFSFNLVLIYVLSSNVSIIILVLKDRLVLRIAFNRNKIEFLVALTELIVKYRDLHTNIKCVR